MPDRYVVPTGGVATGDGGIATPWTFTHAIAAGNTLPGETIFMRAGTYMGPFISFLAGMSDNYITVRPYPGEAVKIDCPAPVSIPSDNTQVWDLPAAPRVSLASGTVAVGKPLTAFSVREIWNGTVGPEIDAQIAHSAFQGKVLIINFGAEYCVPCEWMMQNFVPFYNSYVPPHPFDILYIRGFGPDTVQSVRASGANYSIPYHLALEPQERQIYIDYTVRPGGTIPVTCIIDKQGVVRRVTRNYTPFSEGSSNLAVVKALLAECCLLLQLTGGYVIYREIEFLWSYASRPASPTTNSRYRPTGFGMLDYDSVYNTQVVPRPGVKLVNCIFHDLGNAIEWGRSGPEGAIYGCVFYNNGWDDPLELHADMNLRNEDSTGFLVEDNVAANGYGLGLRATHRVTVNGVDTAIHYFTLRGNVALNKGINSASQKLKDNLYMAGLTDVAEGLVEENYTFHQLSLPTGSGYTGYYGYSNQRLIVRNNVFVGGKNLASVPNYEAIRFENNRLYGTQRFIRAGPFAYNDPGPFQGNAYYNYDSTGEAFELEGLPKHNSSVQWQQETDSVGGEAGTLFDVNAPTGKWIYVRPNRYEPKRAHIIIYNFDNSATVDVNIGQDLLQVGDTYEIRNAQNYYGTPVVAAGTEWNGGVINIPVDNLPAAQPIGQAWDAEHPETPRTRLFNVFVLIGKTAEGAYHGALKFKGADSQGTVATILDAFG